MLGFVGGQLVEVEAFTIPPEQFEVVVRDGRAILLADTRPVEFGISWYCFSKNASIHAKTGEIVVETNDPARFRAVFAGKSIDFSASR